MHPGEGLRHDFWGPLGLTQNALANAIGVPPMRVSEIVRGQRGITADTALRLLRHFNTRPGWWLDLQKHDLCRRRISRSTLRPRRRIFSR